MNLTQPTVNLLMHSDTGSNVCLVTDTSLLHNVVEHKGTVNGTGGGKAKVVAYGDLHALFTITNVQNHTYVCLCIFYRGIPVTGVRYVNK